MIIERILNDIQAKGYSVQEKLFPEEKLIDLKNDILSAYHNNSLKDARVGRSADLEKNIRGDKIQWLTKEDLSEAQKFAWNFLENLKLGFNRNLFFGLKDFETHTTVYPKNTFYKKHIDQFKITGQGMEAIDSKFRKVSFIIYLNEDWNENDGGELKLFDLQNKEIQQILPRFGRAVFFLERRISS